MVQLQKGLKKIESAGLQVVALSYDSVEQLKKFAGAGKVTYPLLSDPGGKIIKKYGLLNPRGRNGLALPATIVIKKDGSVHKNIPGTTRRRHTVEDLVKSAPKAKE